MKRVLAFSGSNSSTSINQAFIEHISTLAHSFELTVIDLTNFPAPLFGVDTEKRIPRPSGIIALHELFSLHDAFIISCPEHNGAMPAFFKNTIDWLSRIEKKVFQQKPVLVFAASPGNSGAIGVLQQFQTLVPRWGGKLVATCGIPLLTNSQLFESYFLEYPNVHADVHSHLQTLAKILEE